LIYFAAFNMKNKEVKSEDILINSYLPRE
jgi:hypothetical protein